MSWTVAADVGGTFTDVVAVDEHGRYRYLKLPSTPGAFEQAVCEGTARAVDGDGATVRRLLHGTTVATNAVLERSGPPAGLITTRGFRDVLEIGRLRVPNSYDLSWTRPAPLADRRHRLEATERVAADGRVLAEPDLETLAASVDAVVEEGVDTFAVSLLNSYANPVNERAIGGWLRARHPHVHVTLGSDVLRDLGEFERTSTAVLNAYLRPVVSGYLEALLSGLRELGMTGPTLIMQSSGGMMPLPESRELPVHILESGPAAGALAAARVARGAGLDRAIGFDMGGTTAKACLIEDGRLEFGSEFNVGADISAMTRLLQAGGYTVRVPSVDLAEVGAGGGSLARTDSGGALAVGPQSAGAHPGPAGYGRGGERATVTDANALLGYISPDGLARGGVTLDLARAAAALERDVAAPLGLTIDDAAEAVHAVADRQMARAIRSVSTERGHDVTEHALIVFGGSGPLHAATLAEAVGIRTVVVPPLAGVLSAVGLLSSPVELTAVAGLGVPLEPEALRSATEQLQAAEHDLAQRLRATGFAEQPVRVGRVLELRYAGQAFELGVDAPPREPLDADRLAQDFRELHRRTYGHGDDAPIELVRGRVTLTVEEAIPELREAVDPPPAVPARRTARFGGTAAEVDVRLRAQIDGPIPGPCLIDDADTTTVVPPGWTVRRDGQNLVLEVAE